MGTRHQSGPTLSRSDLVGEPEELDVETRCERVGDGIDVQWLGVGRPGLDMMRPVGSKVGSGPNNDSMMPRTRGNRR